jgi:aminomethyltransferase
MTLKTPLHSRHLAAGARLVEFGGWEMPQHYTSVREESTAVRTSAGLFDVSHMGRLALTGRAAGEFLQSVVTGDLATLPENQAQYTLMCLPDGGILDDLVVYRGRDWGVVVNAANREKDLAWMRERAPAGVKVLDRTDEVALLALQGPAACSLAGKLGLDQAELLPRFGVGEGVLAGQRIVVSRTGYTGEDGLEVFVPAEAAPGLWDDFLELGVQPCGLAARDVCRLEAGLRLYGSDMDEETNPYEVGLGWTVRLDKGPFCGREALLRLREAPRRQLVGLRGQGQTIPRSGAAVEREGERVGTVTSGTYSFWLGYGIGMASVRTGSVEVGVDVQVASRRGAARAMVVKLPFYRRSAAVKP